MGSSVSYSTQKAQEAKEKSHLQSRKTYSLYRHESCTPDLQSKFGFHQILANGTRKLEFGFKTVGRNVMFKEESASAA